MLHTILRDEKRSYCLMYCFGVIMVVVYVLIKGFICPLVVTGWTDWPIAAAYWTTVIFSLMTWLIEPGYLSVQNA
jgi:hypothetical protein